MAASGDGFVDVKPITPLEVLNFHLKLLQNARLKTYANQAKIDFIVKILKYYQTNMKLVPADNDGFIRIPTKSIKESLIASMMEFPQEYLNARAGILTANTANLFDQILNSPPASLIEEEKPSAQIFAQLRAFDRQKSAVSAQLFSYLQNDPTDAEFIFLASILGWHLTKQMTIIDAINFVIETMPELPRPCKSWDIIDAIRGAEKAPSPLMHR